MSSYEQNQYKQLLINSWYVLSSLTSLRRMQCTITMMKPSRESKTAKRIWKRAERRSVMARTADIQVRAKRGRTTQELHSEAL